MNTTNLLNTTIGLVFFCIHLTGCGAGGSGNAYAAIPEPVAAEDEISQAATQSIAPSTAARDVHQIIIVGDSIMHLSINGDERNTYSTVASILQDAHGKHVTNISRKGQSIQDAAASGVGGAVNYLTMHGNNEISTAVWIEAGVNDWWWYGRTIEEFRQDYTTLLASIERGSNVIVYCVSMLPSKFDAEHTVSEHGTTLEDMRAVVRDMSNAGQCEYVDTAQWFSTAEIYDGYTMPDGLHLANTGHTKYSNMLLEAIK